jgi:hypothetical protein
MWERRLCVYALHTSNCCCPGFPRAFVFYEGGSFATAGVPWAISSKVEGKELIDGY